MRLCKVDRGAVHVNSADHRLHWVLTECSSAASALPSLPPSAPHRVNLNVPISSPPTNACRYHTTWAAIRPRIKQLDSARYMLLYYYGGVYLDADVECVTPLDSLFEPLPPGAAWTGDFPEPMFLASAPGNLFWLHMLRHVARVWRRRDAW